MIKTADWIEILWTAIAVCGFVVQAWLVRDAMQTRSVVYHTQGNGRRKRLANSHARNGFVFCCIHAAFAWAGISAMLEPEAEQPMTPSRAFRISLFMAVATALVVVGLLDRRDRLWFRRRDAAS